MLANFDVTFVKKRDGDWRVEDDVTIESDFNWGADEGSEGKPLTQQYAWFWEKGQKLPHVISNNVYDQISNQVKISSFLFLKTDPNELLYLTAIPNLVRPWRAMTALVDTDWYPASYPWHVVIELSHEEKQIRIKKGEPLCRVHECVFGVLALESEPVDTRLCDWGRHSAYSLPSTEERTPASRLAGSVS